MPNKYFFHPEKKILKQGSILEDENNSVVYEAKMIKQSLIGAMQFEFVNHKTNKTIEHKVGHTITVESETGTVTDMLSKRSHFKFDGKKIWDYLHEQGIRIDSSLSTGKIGMTYDITLKGEPLATIATAAANGGNSIITGPHCYTVETEEENLDLAFLVTFAIARTDQTFYS